MQEQQYQTISSGSAKLAYRRAGSGKPVIFIHAFPFTQQMWDTQFEALSKNFDVITYDQRGFGQSTEGNEKLSIDQLASDLKNLLEALEIKNCVACGLSMGGYVLMNALSRFPELFSGVVLADTQCIAYSDEGKQKRLDTIQKIRSKGLETFAEGFIQTVFCKKSLEEKTNLVKQAKDIIMTNRPEIVCQALMALAERKETCNALKQTQTPALVICGKEDQVTPRSQSELIYNSIAGASLEVLENAGHLSAMEQPEKFNALIKQFVESST